MKTAALAFAHAFAIVCSGALLAACGRAPEGAAPAAAAPAGSSASSASSGAAASAPAGAASAPPVSVTTVPARKRDLAVQLEATGSVMPVSSVDVRPQVTSVITQVHVREGQFVRAGDLLFTLDSRADQANVARLRAQLAKDEAALADAQRQLQRSKDLLAQNFISQGALDSNQTLVDSNRAVVAADKAAIDAAQVALGYARVVAPGAGRVGTINVFAGSAVQANTTSLVTITRLDPIDVGFSVPQRNLPDVLAALAGGGAPVTARLPEKGGSVEGRLQFVDSAVDPATGTVKVKARFDNPAQKLWPGAFVTASLTASTLKDAVVVPQASIIQGPRGTIVYVAADGQAQLRPVQVLAQQGEDAAVSGVRPGEKVVLDGRQNLRPGARLVERAREGGRAASGARPGADGAASAPTAGAASAPTAGAASAPATGAASAPPAGSAPAIASAASGA